MTSIAAVLYSLEDIAALKAKIEQLETRAILAERDRDLMFANLTAVQARCTELLEELRDARRQRDSALARVELWIEGFAQLKDFEIRCNWQPITPVPTPRPPCRPGCTLGEHEGACQIWSAP